MAQLFEETAEPIPGGRVLPPRWRVVPLAGEAFDLAGERKERLSMLSEIQRAAGPLLVRHWDDVRNTEAWILLAPRARPVRVNGRRVLNGICMLRHKDCVEFDAQRLFLSTERVARVEPFTETAGKPAICPRCKRRIEPKSPSVHCPQCRVAYHQTADSDLPCWTYGRSCVLCPQTTTELGESLAWTPETL